MNMKSVSVRRIGVMGAAVAAMIGVSVSAAFGRMTIAEIPVKVNVPATVTLSAVTPQTAWDGDSKALAADVSTVLTISVDEAKTPVLHGRQAATPAGRAAAARYNKGILSIQLPPQQYRDASITLYTVGGKRILSGKAAASNGAFNISRANAAPGVYLLSVKGDGGNTYSTKLTHNGGRLTVNATFDNGDVRSLGKEVSASSMSTGTWKLTAVANGYKTFEETFTPYIGLNAERVITLAAEGEEGDTFVDSRDNTTYKMVTIGSQTWMAENLNFAVPKTGSDSSSYCYNNSPDSCAKYGRLYNWNTAMAGVSSSSTTPSGVQGVCPVGWHLPSDAEWDILIRHIDPSYTSGNHSTAGSKLKSQTGWNTYSGISSTDEYGFSALPGGTRRYTDDVFDEVGEGGHWWSATENNATHARYRSMFHGTNTVRLGWVYKHVGGFSVRCLRD